MSCVSEREVFRGLRLQVTAVMRRLVLMSAFQRWPRCSTVCAVGLASAHTQVACRVFGHRATDERVLSRFARACGWSVSS